MLCIRTALYGGLENQLLEIGGGVGRIVQRGRVGLGKLLFVALQQQRVGGIQGLRGQLGELGPFQVELLRVHALVAVDAQNLQVIFRLGRDDAVLEQQIDFAVQAAGERALRGRVFGQAGAHIVGAGAQFGQRVRGKHADAVTRFAEVLSQQGRNQAGEVGVQHFVKRGPGHGPGAALVTSWRRGGEIRWLIIGCGPARQNSSHLHRPPRRCLSASADVKNFTKCTLRHVPFACPFCRCHATSARSWRTAFL
nr:hypothetical protein [Azohydromonas lata]